MTLPIWSNVIGYCLIWSNVITCDVFCFINVKLMLLMGALMIQMDALMIQMDALMILMGALMPHYIYIKRVQNA